MKCKHQITVDTKGIIELEFEDFVRDCLSSDIFTVFYDQETNYLVNYVYWTSTMHKKRGDVFIAINFVTEVGITQAPACEYRKYIVYDDNLSSPQYTNDKKEVDFSDQSGSIMVLKDAKVFREIMKTINKMKK